MSVEASFIAYRKSIVAEDKVSTEQHSVIGKMLDRLPRHDTKVSYQYDSLTFHFLIENEIVYACISTTSYEMRAIYGFLAKVKDSFKTKFAGSKNRYPKPQELTQVVCSSFSHTLRELTKEFNTNPTQDKFSQIKDEIKSTQQVMLENLDNVIGRGEKIDNLCDRTTLLQQEAQGFHSGARGVKRALMKHNLILIGGVVLLLGVIALIIAMLVCGVDFKKC